MKKCLLILSALLGGAAFPGCTGDPNSGGIFWSESKARQRIAVREDHLNAVEADTARVRRRHHQADQ